MQAGIVLSLNSFIIWLVSDCYHATLSHAGTSNTLHEWAWPGTQARFRQALVWREAISLGSSLLRAVAVACRTSRSPHSGVPSQWSVRLASPKQRPLADLDWVAQSTQGRRLDRSTGTGHGSYPTRSQLFHSSTEAFYLVCWIGPFWSEGAVSQKSGFFRRRGFHCKKWRALPYELSFRHAVLSIAASSYCRFLLVQQRHQAAPQSS